jgi:hypothetical protein
MKSMGRLHGIQIFPLDILDERDFQQAIVRDFADDYGDLLNFSQFGGTPSSFSSNQLEAVANPADNQWLNNAVSANGLCQLGQPFVLEEPARLQGVGIDGIHRNGERTSVVLGRERCRRNGGAGWQQ